MNNRCNKFFPAFSPLDKKFSLGNYFHDSFSDQVSFYPRFYNIKIQLCKLNDIVITSSSDLLLCIIVSNTSIKNYIATFILHIYSFNQPIVKICHQAINISTTEAEFFTIRCSINQAVGIPHIKQIIVITDSLHVAKRIFNLFPHLYQLQSAAISYELRDFFHKGINNSIEFCDCPSKEDWYLYSAVDKDSKNFSILTYFPSMFSQDFSKKHIYNNIISQWKMSFQAFDLKGKSFLDLLDSDSNLLIPLNINSSQ